MSYLSKEQIEELRQFDTPTVSNAIEKFKLRSKIEGFTSPKIKAIYPDRKPVVGYACTAKISARYPGPRKMKKPFISIINPFLTVPQSLSLSFRILMRSRLALSGRGADYGP
nr:hypothetical protein [uncultured Sphaerochaeta sp.]